jgi:hypothetical protein
MWSLMTQQIHEFGGFYYANDLPFFHKEDAERHLAILAAIAKHTDKVIAELEKQKHFDKEQ